MISLNSGLPGSGKTLNAVFRGIAWVKEGRQVWALGINGLDEEATGIKVYPWDLSEWGQRLQPGDVLIVDEVQFFIKKGTTIRNVPEWVELLTRNRHLGIDMLWTTQRVKNIDPFIRGLINEHRHFVNKYGAQKSRVYFWQNEGVEEPDLPSQRQRAEASDFTYPKEIYPMYKSAELHTRKWKMPRGMKLVIGGLLAFVCIAGFAAYYINAHFVKPDAARSAASAPQEHSLGSPLSGGLLTSPTGVPQKVLTKAEWIAKQVPRVEGMPWSAPLFDDRKPGAQPDIFCIKVEDIKCNCYTEQVTLLDVGYKMCVSIATHGVYNPYRRPIGGNQVEERTRSEQPQRVESLSRVHGESELQQSDRGADHAILRPVSPPYAQAPAR